MATASLQCCCCRHFTDFARLHACCAINAPLSTAAGTSSAKFRSPRTGFFLAAASNGHSRMFSRVKETLNPAALKYRKGVAELGGDPVLHGVGLLEGEKDVWSSLKERFGHMLVLGATRVGKTTLAGLLIGQDVAARRHRDCFWIPKGTRNCCAECITRQSGQGG